MVDVCAGIERLAAGDLGRDVLGARVAGAGHLGGRLVEGHQVPHADAGDDCALHPERIANQENIAGLEVEVELVGLVERRQGRKHLKAYAHCAAGFERAVALHHLGEAVGEHRLNQEREAVLVVAEAKDRHQVGVAQRGGLLGVGERVLNRLAGWSKARVEHLDRNGAALLLVERLVDGAHRTLAELALDLVDVHQGLADEADLAIFARHQSGASKRTEPSVIRQ